MKVFRVRVGVRVRCSQLLPETSKEIVRGVRNLSRTAQERQRAQSIPQWGVYLSPRIWKQVSVSVGARKVGVGLELKVRDSLG